MTIIYILLHVSQSALSKCLCQFDEIAIYIKKLMHLKVLDIRNTGINYLPIQIGCLTQLKCLRTSLSNFGLGQSRAMEFRRNVLSKLSLLEELRIGVDPNNRRCMGGGCKSHY
jgi:hypothetical protein